MNISRNNYETYFLLFADNELNAADKQAVEHFISLHPDLGEELERLMETVLDIAPITMPGKHLLLKPEEWQEENLTAQQEEMFLLLDKELPDERAKVLLETIASDPLLQQDWSTVKQSQLIGAVVEMPNKESLYRTATDRRPIAINRVKWLAAAAVLAGLGWYGISVWNTQQVSNTPPVAVVTKDQNNNAQPGKNNPGSTVDHSINDSNSSQTSVGIKVGNTTRPVTTLPVETVKTTTSKAANNIKQPIDAGKEPAAVYTVSEKQQPVIQTVQETGIPGNAIAAIDPNEITNSLANQVNQHADLQSSPGKEVVYNEDGADETEYVNIAGARIKKQKLRGIFRNVTRTVGRTFDKSNVAQADVASLR